MIDRAKIKGLLAQMRQANFKSATLGGALVARHGTGFVICRDPVAVKGRQDSHHERQDMKSRLGFQLKNMPLIWDGRFFVKGSNDTSYISTVHHDSDVLTAEQRQFLKSIPAPARATLPVTKHESNICSVGHGNLRGFAVKSLTRLRLQAALGGQIS